MKRESLENVLNEAKREISAIERQLVTLTARRRLLWSLVESSRQVMENDSPGESAPGRMDSAAQIIEESPAIKSSLVAPSASSVSLPTNRIWEAVQLVMSVAKKPVTVPEIADLLERHKIIVGGEHPRENIRSAITRRDDVFEKLDRRGFYVLREWPDIIKQLREDEPISTETT